MLRFMGSQRVGHDWATELNWMFIESLLCCCQVASIVSNSATPQMAAHQAPPSLGFSRQEHWSGLPFPSPMHESEKWKWSCSVSVRLFVTPLDYSLPGSCVHGIFQARVVEWGAIAFSGEPTLCRHNSGSRHRTVNKVPAAWAAHMPGWSLCLNLPKLSMITFTWRKLNLFESVFFSIQLSHTDSLVVWLRVSQIMQWNHLMSYKI